MAPRDRGQSSFDRSYQWHNKDAGQRFRLLFLTSATHARRMEAPCRWRHSDRSLRDRLAALDRMNVMRSPSVGGRSESLEPKCDLEPHGLFLPKRTQFLGWRRVRKAIAMATCGAGRRRRGRGNSLCEAGAPRTQGPRGRLCPSAPGPCRCNCYGCGLGIGTFPVLATFSKVRPARRSYLQTLPPGG